MAAALGKPHVHLVGVDDGAFTRRHRYAPIVAVFTCTGGPVDSVVAGRARVDGTDATERIAELLRGAPQLDGTRAVLLDGRSVAGFNLIDLDRLSHLVGRPIVAVTHRAPDLPAIRSALWSYFRADFRRRWALVRDHPPRRVQVRGRELWVSQVGTTHRDAVALLQRTAESGVWPEPLRLAHLIARAIARPSRPVRSKVP